MNIAYLLLGTACITGQPEKIAAPKTAQPTAPPVVHHGPIAHGAHGAPGCCDSGCGGGCDDCCDSGRTRWRDRIRGWFRRGHNDCCDTCAPTCAPTCTTSCDSCCGDSWGRRFRDRMRGWFRRGHNDCCDTCNDGCGHGGAGCASPGCGGAPFVPHGHVPHHGPMPPAGKGKEAEKIGPPMGEGAAPMSRMPEGGGAQPAARPGQFQINIAPAAPAPAAAPALQPAPAAAPNGGNTEQRPF